MKYVRYTLVLTAGLLAVACTPDGPRPVSSSGTSENGMLTVDPATVDLCSEPEGVIAADVSWNAASVGTEGVEVWLQGPGEEKKLWSADGAVSSSRTGRWLRDGSLVILVNGEDKQELARIRIEARPCSR